MVKTPCRQLSSVISMNFYTICTLIFIELHCKQIKQNSLATLKRKHRYSFLEDVAKKTHGSKAQTRLELARKLNEKTRLIQKRRKQNH